MRATSLLPLALFLIACGKPEDPLSGRWDVADPDGASKGNVTVGEFKDGRVKFERRGEVLGIGLVSVTTTGTYSVSGSEVTLTKEKSEIDASAIADPKLRAQTVKVLEGIAKGSGGKPMKYSLKIDSPQRISLVDESGSLTLSRAR